MHRRVKLKRAESRLQKGRYCYFCGCSSVLHRHHVFGASNRMHSEADGLTVFLCPEHHEEVHRHSNSGKALELKTKAQQAYERDLGTREEFRERYGRSWL